MKKRLSIEPFDHKALSVGALLRVHRQFRPSGYLPRNLGDGFLCSENRIFSNLRKEAIRRGIRFSDRLDTPTVRNYYAFPLMSLDEIVDSREIPYRPNAVWLEILEKRAPGIFSITELKRGELQFNYLFHESAHLVAHDEFFGRKSILKVPKNSETLLAFMLGEAYANTVECLSSAIEGGEVASFFLDANCHFRANVKELRVMRRWIERRGFSATGRVLLGAFLYANYLYEKLGIYELEEISVFAGIEDGRKIRDLAEIGLGLNGEFRSITTPFHLVKTGFSANLKRLFSVDPMRVLLSSKGKNLKNKAVSLVDLAVDGAIL